MKTKTLLAILILFIAGCTNSETENSGFTRKVVVTRVKMDQAILQSKFSGVIKEASENNLAFRVAGPIQKIYVKEGDYVAKGELIAEIDQRDYQVQLDVAQAQYKQVKAETERVTEMYKRKSIADMDYEKAVAGDKLVATQLKHAEDQLLDTKLFAPFSGYVQDINFEEGEMINTGLPFATLINLDSYTIEIDIPASLFVQKDQFTGFTCRNLETGSGELPLKLTSYSMKANKNQLYKLYFSLDPKADKNLAPGMDAEVVISRENPEKLAFYIPLESVFNQSGSSYVWVFNPEKSIVNKIQVETGRLTSDGNISITSGLTGNEQVVTAGVNALQDKQKVEILKRKSKTNIGGLL